MTGTKTTWAKIDETAVVEGTLEIIRENERLTESLLAVSRILQAEDAGWESIISDSGEYGGIQLEELQERSAEIRSAIVKSPVLGRGAHLRTSYVWSKGINIPDMKPDTESKSGPKSAARAADELRYEQFKQEINYRYIFSATAQEEMERCAYSDGNFFALADSKTKTIRRVPLQEITAFISNPDFIEEVWAWQRTWMQVDKSGKAVEKKVWYYTDDCPLPLAERAKTKIRKVDVDHTKVMIAQSFNKMVGWPLGIPDAVSVIAWAKLYSDFLKHGYVMNRALASIAFKATTETKDQGQRASMRLAETKGSAGKTAVLGAASNLQALPSAGRSYDFDGGRPLAALVATGVQVSIVHLLSDPGAAGSSYGSASNLDLPTKRAIVSRQRAWASYFERILRWFGVDEPVVSFPSLEEPDFYREVQALMLGWNSGNIHPREMRARLLELLDIVTDDKGDIPGVLIPNNAESMKQVAAAQPKPAATTASPDQGQSKGTGDAKDSGDLRNDDKVGESLRALMETSERERLEGLMVDLIETLERRR